MRCIVTAGPTFEWIDRVRRITNFSTGTLGSGLAGYLSRLGHEVHLLLGEAATCTIPQDVKHITRFSTAASLREILSGLTSAETGAVFHAAAVSDFTLSGVYIRSASGCFQPVAFGKVPSGVPSLWLELKPVPKIIAELRQWFPSATIVGWKYEVDGDRESAIARGLSQIAACATSACVVNGPAYGEGYGLVRGPGSCQHLEDVQELYQELGRLLSR
ncbi:MAG: phosphopantothenoylcysteine decarboxylase [Verrucomicrobiae bacterium]|nr:phosphopantothenoylcysteine decarboxylase [Verrucomicrobiae bacterium]